MAGHIQDRWWRDKLDAETGKPVLNSKGKPEQEKTELYGVGLRYKARYYDDTGKERSKSFPDKQLGKAQAFLTKMQHDVLSGEYVDPAAGDEKFRAYIARWRKGQSQDAGNVQTVTHRLNGQVLPFLGDLPMRVVEKPDTIRDWLEWMQTNGKRTQDKGSKLEASYRAQLFDLVSAILEGAKDDKVIKSNPCKAKSIKKPKVEKKKIVPWPESKLRKIHLALPPRYKIVVPLGAGEAMRQGEILGFSADDINREEMELNIVRQIRWIGDTPVFAPPKGGKPRVVPLATGVLEDIDDYSDEFEPVEVTLPWLEPGGRLVTVNVLVNFKEDGLMRRGAPHERLQPWRGSNFTMDVWRVAFEQAGVPYVNRVDGMHAMRHFCASNWLANGSSIKEVSEYLGHHDPGYTLRIYTHLVPSSHKRARLATDRVFKPRKSKKDSMAG